MGCAASAANTTNQPMAQASGAPPEPQSQGIIDPQQTMGATMAVNLGFETRVLSDGASPVLLRTLTYPTIETDDLHESPKSPRLTLRHALQRVSGLLQLAEPVGAVPKELLLLQNELNSDRFVPLLRVSSDTLSSPDGSALRRLYTHSKHFPDASSLEAFCGNAEEELVEEFFLAVSEALCELHDRKAAHLNLHPRNVFRVPQESGESRYLMSEFGWGQLWIALTVRERRTFNEEFVIPPELVAINHDVPIPRSLEACIKEDTWSLGSLLYRLIYGVVPMDDGTANGDRERASSPTYAYVGRDLEFPLRSSSGWDVSDRWVWLLSSLLAVDPQERPSNLRVVRDEFHYRTVKRKASRVEAAPVSPFLSPEFSGLVAFPSGISLGSEAQGKPSKKQSGPRGRSTFGAGFQLNFNLASFLLAETDQQSQSTTSMLSTPSGSHHPSGEKFSNSVSVSGNRSHQAGSSSHSTADGPMIDVSHSPPLALSLAAHGDIFVDESDSIRCVRCGGDVAPLAFRCTQCPEFILCSGCFVEHGETHDPEHCILTFAVEKVKESALGLSVGQSVRGGWRSVHSESLAATSMADESLEGSRNLFISATALSSHERTVLGMTGKLPAGRQLDTLKRKKSLWTLSTSEDVSAYKLAPAAPTVHQAERNETNGKKPSPVFTLLAEPPSVEMSEDDIVSHCCAENVSTLELCELGLVAVPACISSMALCESGELSFRHVTVLDLANNTITEIPSALCHLFPSLMTFLAGNNQLTSFPETVSEMVNLQRLELHRNKLTCVPTSMVRLSKLSYCSLDDNDLDAIPEFVWKIPSLETVFLALNPRLKHWPPLHALVDLLDGVGNLEIGLDNAPSLWSVFRTTLSERCPSLTVVWNKIYPDEILPGLLYLGALRSAQSPEVYEELRIGSVLTVGRGLVPKIMPVMRHFTLDVDDLPGSSIVDRFAPCFHFIDEAPELKPDAPGVLVHCWAGMSRSATCVIAYLMQKFQWRLVEAYAHTKARREAIQPNDGFMEQLKAYDRHLFNPE